MTEAEKDTLRAVDAAKIIIDGRDIQRDSNAILVTLEGVVALLLISAMRNDTNMAAAMLNEGLVPGVESRIALAASRRAGAQ